MSESNGEQSFAEMMGQSFDQAPRAMEPGEQVEAVVVRVSSNSVFLDIGGKSEGYIEKSEFIDGSGNVTVQEGDRIKAYFLSTRKNEMLFTTNLGGGPAAKSHLEEAYHSKIPVEGNVVKEVKGGFEIKVAGSVRAFCPYSQMGLRRVESPEEYVGENFSFRISQYEEDGRNIVLSRRALLEEERQLQKESLKASLQVGMTVKGKITSIREFGAFVDTGGIEGLIPVSEIGWGHVDDIHGVISVGQEVEVSILKLDWESDKFSFSLKNTMPDPWDQAAEKYREGTFYTGKVARLVPFGVFVTLEEGVDGLVHISNLGGGRRINHPREVVSEGEVIEVRIDSVDREKKRISLSLAVAARMEEEEQEVEKETKKFIEKSVEESSGSMGTLGDLFKNKSGK
ncbi:MAG: 30S ribosomal protein S1 [Proteobacteria bacterium]|nr:30S ribosomal protein S1 [Pseudomonadota bacterium]MBU1717315.1 30S ribosomal protein S1 [Pseudomonadota bacterium]